MKVPKYISIIKKKFYMHIFALNFAIKKKNCNLQQKNSVRLFFFK